MMNNMELLYSDASQLLTFGPVMFIALIILGLFILPVIFFYITIQNTLKVISERNRQMPPGQVWLCLIPLFGIAWNFVVLERLSNSISLELRKYGQAQHERPVYGIGLTSCILSACCIIPCLNYIVIVPYLVVWIIYWVKIAEYKRRLEELGNMSQQDEGIFSRDL